MSDSIDTRRVLVSLGRSERLRQGDSAVRSSPDGLRDGEIIVFYGNVSSLSGAMMMKPMKSGLGVRPPTRPTSGLIRG